MNMPNTTTPFNKNISGYIELSNLAVIEATGPDAIHFLHHQLTQDLLLLPAHQGRLAAYCSAKGRILASFYIVKVNPEKVLLVCKKDALESTIKRLKMFILRAKVQLRDASLETPIWGLVGDMAKHFFASSDTPLPPPWSALSSDEFSVLSLYEAQGVPRAIYLGLPDKNHFQSFSPINQQDWDLLNVLSGVCLIGQNLADAFVPQMINYESIGGVNFKKGCYPGQEVVARSQFRGTLKRRLYIATSDELATPGQELTLTSDPEQACGTVIESTVTSQGKCYFLASMQISAAEQATNSVTNHATNILCLASQNNPNNTNNAEGCSVQLLPLPYELLSDI